MRGDSNSCVGMLQTSRWQVHPHVRGDSVTNPYPTQTPMTVGFTPTCVGTATTSPEVGFPVLARFTPTCVGTASGKRDRRDRRVHPHVRGDRNQQAPLGILGAGSPPRAWGQRWRGRTRTTAKYGFTPTCVGTARRWPCRLGRQTVESVHPHVRGDSVIRPRSESSPTTRFTPTCVGTAG